MMRRSLLCTMITIVCVTAAWAQETTSATSSAVGADPTTVAVPRLIKFSGVLNDSGTRPLHGVVEVSLSLYKEEAGGEPLWFETQTVEVDEQGRYTVLLGAMHAQGLTMDLFTSGEAKWLAVQVGKLPEQPRVLLVSVPYALKAGDVETLGGKPASAFVTLTSQAGSDASVSMAASTIASTGAGKQMTGTSPTPKSAISSGPTPRL